MRRDGAGKLPMMENPFEKELVERFLKAIALGMSIKAACDYASIGEGTFYQWQRKAEKAEENGEGDENVYVKFMKDFKKSKSSCMARHLARITQASDDGSWQASAWILERRFPEDFAQHNDVSMDDSRITIVAGVKREDNGD